MQNRERIIDIKALFRCIVEKWRFLILTGILVGAVLAGMKGYSEYKLYKKSMEQPQTALEETGPLKNQILNVMKVAEDYRNEYYVNSLLGEINPHAEGKATADIIVTAGSNAPAEEAGQITAQAEQTGQEGQTAAAGDADAAGTAETAGTTDAAETTDAAGAAEAGAAETAAETAENAADAAEKDSVSAQTVARYYATSVQYRIDYTQAAEKLGVEPSQLNELVTASQDGSLVSVSVIYPTEEGAKVILDSVLSQIRASQAEAEAIYGDHDILVTNEASGLVVDLEMYKWANNRAVEIMSLINSQKTLGNNLSSGTSGQIAAVSQRDVAMTAVKWGVMGLIAGIAAAVILVAIYLLAAGKVLSGREFNRHFGLKKIACVPGRKFTALKGLDKWAGSIDSAYYNHPQRNVCLQVADANIRAAVRPDAQIALVGDLPPEYIDKLAAEMNKSGAAAGLRTSYFAIPCQEQTPESVISVVNCDAAVIVAKAEKSTYKGAEDVMDSCALLGRDVIGSIVLM